MRPSDSSRASVPDSPWELGVRLLDLLVDGPSSVAAIYASAVRNLGFPSTTAVEAVVGALEELRVRGLVRAGLVTPHGGVKAPSDWEVWEACREYCTMFAEEGLEDPAVDPVGLWYEITPVGRKVWATEEDAHRLSPWRVDERIDQGTVTVKAATEEAAEELMRWWAESNVQAKVDLSKPIVQRNVRFRVADGSVIEGGVEITCPIRGLLDPH